MPPISVNRICDVMGGGVSFEINQKTENEIFFTILRF